MSGSRWSTVLYLQYREKEGLEEMIFFFPLHDLKALQKYNMSVLQEKKAGVGWMTRLIVLYGVSLEDK